MPRKQQNKKKRDWHDGELETEPGEHLSLKNKGKRVCNADAIGKLLNQLNKEKPGYSKYGID